jgi:hypothetical protein
VTTTGERRDLSRPIRLATELTGEPEAELTGVFLDRRVMVAIERGMEGDPDARLTVQSLCNQILRFCPNLTVRCHDATLASECLALARLLHGHGHGLHHSDDLADADVSITVGTETSATLGAITVNSSGWVARIATSPGGSCRIPWQRCSANSVGAIAAGCLGAGEVFLRLIGCPVVLREHELNMLTGATGHFGEFGPGPKLPEDWLRIDALLAGCGGVGNGWTETVRHLRVRGTVSAVDRQAVEDENLGPYTVATTGDVGAWKAEVVRRALEPSITVKPYPEELDLFVPRIAEWGMPLSPIVLSGFDAAEPRHTLQRLWPETLIDMAAGGATAQCHIYRAGRGGQCLLGAHTIPLDAVLYADRVAAMTGLRPERITHAYNQAINEDDVAAAPEEYRETLEAARRSGVLICGRITRANREDDKTDGSFAPAAPFVAGLSGAMGASLTVQVLIETAPASGFHWQYNFESGRSRALVMSCAEDCECRSVKAPRPSDAA